MMGQPFHYGDHVKIADNYANGWKIKEGKSEPIFSQEAGEEAIVIASYNDQFGTPDTGGDYTLFVKNKGEISWFPPSALKLIKRNAQNLLKQWEKEKQDEIKKVSNLDYIFNNPEIVLTTGHGAAINSLASCLGISVDEMWGSHGEGFVYFGNAMAVAEIAKPFLNNKDKEGWLKFCDKAKKDI